MDSHYLSPKQIMAYLGLPRRTIYRLIEDGQLPAMRIGDPDKGRQSLYIPRQAVETWAARADSRAEADQERTRQRKRFLSRPVRQA